MRPIRTLLTGILSVALLGPALAQAPAPVAPATPIPVAAPATPVPPADKLNAADLEAWLDGLVPYVLEQADVAGSVVVVVKDGQVLLEKGYGYADLAAKTPVDPQGTLFRPGSVSKLFTWTAVMQLVEQGKLDLDKDVNTYIDFKIPDYQGKPVTLRNIMTHTTGMEEQIRWLIATDPNAVAPLDAALKHWVPERIFAPGGTPAYSNYATAVAGYIVQRVSGEPFDAYIKRHIFDPLGMQHSSFSQPLQPALLAQMSKGYITASDGKPQPYELINMAPAGSLAASGADMGRFMIAHLQKGEYNGARILSEATAVQMHSTAQASVGPLNKMMLGFYETTVNGHRAIAHGGDTMWFHSDLQLFLDDGIGIYVSTNSAGKDGAARNVRASLVTGFADRYLPLTGALPASTVDAATARLHAQQVAGAYMSSRRAQSNFMSILNVAGLVKIVANEDGTISVPMLTKFSGAARKWREVSPYVWRDVDGGDRLAADVVDGQVTRFSVDGLAAIMVFQRQPGWVSLLVPLAVASLLALLLTVLAWPVSALVRRHYGVRYALTGGDARSHRAVRIAALLVLASVLSILWLVVSMMSDLNMMTPDMDGTVIGLRLFALVMLPVGTLVGLWNAKNVLASHRSRWAKLWSIVLAIAFLSLLWIGLRHHLMGFSAFY
ncbi:serine hydrolase domain-containing protein [Thermomonas carbonis]|uniref:Beta-lactamase family protein n=1 Tax=Thermomonas carbonis TaxID=1463158 RepID=A0A7G9SLR7_9GAMM|nr:serine hydrolase domain-containing protein [Thermomonas carbonis]QNN68792.1 beta-lactamase family protein [Thermomonas carbonis]GHC08741.1 hypothetical protein GCM10010080_24710 [Thermomonas carbonis]